ncbi:hypothetical protein FACS1894132_05610 [Clostridia bacterium]|nr:hypothetical protein FACS1894132_05610 [Clostridia bacterium]
MANFSNLPNLNGTQNGDIVTFDYSGAAVNLSLPPGIYRLKCYGGQGGYRSNTIYGGQGGYAEGLLTLTSEVSAWLYVGGSGNTGGQNGGFNGGGIRESNLPGGGGATDIRLVSDNLLARVIVAGGGGSDGASNKPGGHGGGEAGVGRGESYGSGGGGASQTAGGVGGNVTLNGSFGQGGAGVYYATGHGGAGGGGWYGGGGTYPDSSGDDDRGGGGGSGYALTANSVKPTGYLLGEDFYLTETLMSQGGRNGDGLIIIEIIEIGKQKFLARDNDGVKAWNGENWTLIEGNLGEELFLESGVDRLPQSVSGLLDEAKILAWTDRVNIVENPDNFTLKLTANVTAPTQTITQTVPFELPENAVVSSISLVKAEQNGGAVDVDYVAENGEIRLTYTLEKPSETAIAGIQKINVMFGEATE